MDIELTTEECRVLGCLLEKKMATPEYYPLTLNALINACNQKVSRTPVVTYGEATVRAAIEGLRSKQLLWINTSGRVAKNSEALVERCELTDDQAAILCVQLLRGPQTVGELRSRTERLYSFADLSAVHQTLEALTEQGLVAETARQPGQKETRYGHLFGDNESYTPTVSSTEPDLVTSGRGGRVAQLEERVSQLEDQVQLLQQTFEQFKTQFE